MHPELKILKAELIRLNFEDYLRSEYFRLLILEKDIDVFFNRVLDNRPRFDKERRTDTFMLILNDFLQKYNNAQPNSNESNAHYTNFLFLLKNIIFGYYEFHQQPVNPSKIIQCIQKISMINKKDLALINVELKNIANRKVEVELQNKNKKVKIENDNEEIVDSQNIDYAIITALEDDEMEKILPFIVKISEVEGSKNLIEIGHFKDNPDKKIIYASQHSTGMVDAAILASELIIRFKPTYLIMVGVLGGKPEDTNIGDVIVATKVIEIDRGKITETGFKKETSVANITSKVLKKISRAKGNIEEFLNKSNETRNSEIKLHFGPIACVNQVIDLPDFFSENISSIERKAIALEMESFSVVRACELLNEGRTSPIIIKSVMDNTHGKTDDAKPYAAWTSAKTLQFVLENNII